MRGANSVLYGDSAIAGSINIITKRGEGKPKGDATFIGGSYNTYNGRAGVRGSADKVYYALNGEVLTSSGYRDRSKFTTESAGGSIGYNPTDALDVSLGITANKTDNQFPGALTQAQYNANRKQAQNPDDDASSSFFDANLLIKTILGSYGRLDANLIYGKREVTSNYASFASFTKIDIDTVGATPRYILDKKLFGFDNKLTVGFDFYNDKLDKDTFADRSQASRTYEAELKRQTMGLYARDEFSILKDLILALGARTERADVNGSETNLATGVNVFDAEKVHKGTAWEGSLTYLFGENSKLWGKYATIYRFPSLDQQASYYAFPFDTFLTDLEKETGTSYEVGTQFYPMKELKLGLTFYLIDMEDEISYNPVTFRNENLDKTRHQGIEFSLDWQFRKLARLYANYTFQEAYLPRWGKQGQGRPARAEEHGQRGPRHLPALEPDAAARGPVRGKPVLRLGLQQQLAETRQLHDRQSLFALAARLEDFRHREAERIRGGGKPVQQELCPRGLQHLLGADLLPGAGDQFPGRGFAVLLIRSTQQQGWQQHECHDMEKRMPRRSGPGNPRSRGEEHAGGDDA